MRSIESGVSFEIEEIEDIDTMLQSRGLVIDPEESLHAFRASRIEAPIDREIPGHIPSTNLRVRIVRTAAQLQRVVAVRMEAYSSRLPELAEQVSAPEDLDYSHGAIVLLAEDCNTGRAYGTLRLNTGRDMLAMMDDIQLPREIVEGEVAYISRMAAVGNAKQKSAVRRLIEKAMFQLCAAKQLRTVLILAVVPRERLFYHWGFSDVFPDEMPRHPQFLNKIAVRALQCETYTIERTWREKKHPLYDYFFRTFHPEIEVFMSVSSLERRSGESDVRSTRLVNYQEFVN
jgi:hypothetical protein